MVVEDFSLESSHGPAKLIWNCGYFAHFEMGYNLQPIDGYHLEKGINHSYYPSIVEVIDEKRGCIRSPRLTRDF